MLRFLCLIFTVCSTAWIIHPPITVVGVSAGCFMATQIHFAYSMTIKGMACIAGGPFWCAQNNVEIALSSCMTGPPPDISYLADVAIATAADGFLDPLVGLADSRVWFYTALNDTIVSSDVVFANYRLYQKFIHNPELLTIISNHSGEHSQVTATRGNDCMYLGEPFINACGYDAAEEQLNFLHGSVRTGAAGTLYTIPQPFAEGLGPLAYLWAPNTCLNTSCVLNIAFHGCEQTIADIGLAFVEDAGYNGFDNVMTLYPQAVSTVINPRGCFDWWGYTGSTYASNVGVQMMAVRQMIMNIAGF